MDQLKLHNQVCFPVYTLAKEIVARYRPLLDKLDLTYPQYLVMLVLWEQDSLKVSQIGERLNLDSGTLTPLLKRLEQKQLVSRTRSDKDERTVLITVTQKGQDMQVEAKNIPYEMMTSLAVSPEELRKLKEYIEHVLSTMS